METAYTIGFTKSYDYNLSEIDDCKKLGKQEISEDYPDGYDGGWVFKSIQEANDFIKKEKLIGFSVYQLELPTSWDVDVNKIIGDDGAFNLLNNSLIVKKIDESIMKFKEFKGI